MERAEHAPHALGRWGEERATRHLREQGWCILARNYRFGRREVDLVVRQGGLVVFVEVKTRGGEGYGNPLEAITRLKRREVEVVADHFLRSRGLHDVSVRFDAIAIVVRLHDEGTEVVLEHVEDAWRPGWD